MVGATPAASAAVTAAASPVVTAAASAAASAAVIPPVTPPADVPGRSCPLAYCYTPAVFCRAPQVSAQTLYVIGGLYGNPYALDAIDAMAQHEASAPTRIFNGDFHWFDLAPAVFATLHERVLEHVALRGNVETELAGDDHDAGCGCAYPLSVSDDEVARSNQILLALRKSAGKALGGARASLIGLPIHLLAQVGAARVAIVHGDGNSLAGWDFSREQLDDPARRARNEQLFRTTDVTLFASSHTCLPVLRRFRTDGKECGVINNGAAGMPNFAGTQHGVISRIACTPAPATLPVLYEKTFQQDGERLYAAALAVHYDQTAWLQRFDTDWPSDSPASLSYRRRIVAGPDYAVRQACPAGFR